jgi:hypothetical protein
LFGNGVSGIFHFYILRDGNNILPVDWLSFTGTATGNSNNLNWSTATETQNDYFTLEKSADGINFEVLATFPGAGDAIFQNDYSTTDENPFYQTYYRISQTDYDGTVNEGPSIVVINDSRKTYLSLRGNPVSNGQIKLNYRTGNEQQVTFTLTGLDGKRISNWSAALVDGTSNLTLQIPGIAPGIYILSALVNNERWVDKVVVR